MEDSSSAVYDLFGVGCTYAIKQVNLDTGETFSGWVPSFPEGEREIRRLRSIRRRGCPIVYGLMEVDASGRMTPARE